MTDSDGICCDGGFKITVDGETVISNNGGFSESVQETFVVGSSDLVDEVAYDCSDPLSGCSTVRHFESRTRESCMPLAYYLSWRYHAPGNVSFVSKFPSHSLIDSFCHESRLSSKSSMMTFPRKQAGRSATTLVL
jgi:hypothetical protein